MFVYIMIRRFEGKMVDEKCLMLFWWNLICIKYKIDFVSGFGDFFSLMCECVLCVVMWKEVLVFVVSVCCCEISFIFLCVVMFSKFTEVYPVLPCFLSPLSYIYIQIFFPPKLSLYISVIPFLPLYISYYISTIPFPLFIYTYNRNALWSHPELEREMEKW